MYPFPPEMFFFFPPNLVFSSCTPMPSCVSVSLLSGSHSGNIHHNWRWSNRELHFLEVNQSHSNHNDYSSSRSRGLLIAGGFFGWRLGGMDAQVTAYVCGRQASHHSVGTQGSWEGLWDKNARSARSLSEPWSSELLHNRSTRANWHPSQGERQIGPNRRGAWASLTLSKVAQVDCVPCPAQSQERADGLMPRCQRVSAERSP